MDDDSLAIRRLKDGDIGGLESLGLRYQVKAVRTAFLILRDEQLAEALGRLDVLEGIDRLLQACERSGA